MDPGKISRSEYLTSKAKILALVYLGYNRKRKLIDAGLSVSVVYTNLLKLITDNLVEIDNSGRIILTERGRIIAEKIIKCAELF